MTTFNAIKLATGRNLSKGLLLVQKFSPEILTGVGVVTAVASGVMLVKATLKVEPIIDRHAESMETVNELYESVNEKTEEVERAYIQDKTQVFVRTTLDFVKLYGPAVTMGALSIGSFVGAHGIMRKRNVALVAAYKVMEESFSEYRSRVAAELGEDAEIDILSSNMTKEVVVADDEGKEIKETVIHDGASPYAKFFSELNPNWSKDPESNLFFLKSQENYFNHKLSVTGYVFLSDVYKALGIAETPASRIVGWIYKDGQGDGYIDFGVTTLRNEMAINHTTSRADGSYLLDFNVDGVIYEQI